MEGAGAEISTGAIRHTSVPDLIHDLANRNKDIRWAAASALARIGEPAVDPLIAALEDPDSVVRLRAAWALGQIGDHRAVKKLIGVLGDGDWSVRMRAAEALGKLGAKEATEALLHLLRDAHADVRRHAIGALTKVADAGSVDRIGGMLKDSDWRVRMGAALALSAIGDEKSMRYLNDAACDENEYVRKIAMAVTKSREGESCPAEVSAGRADLIGEGTLHAVTAGGREILLAKVNDTVYAINNICMHKGCRLSEGRLDGDIVTCHCHGSSYNVKTGANVTGPAKQPEPSYPVTVVNGEIRIRL